MGKEEVRGKEECHCQESFKNTSLPPMILIVSESQG